MAVRLHIMPAKGEGGPKPAKPAAKVSVADRRLLAFAPEIMARQAAGHITSRQLCERLKADGLLNASGKPWAEATLFRMLKRGKKLGLAFVVRSKSQAASERVPDYRTPAMKRAEREAGFRRLLEFARSRVKENGALTISSSVADLRSDGRGTLPHEK